LSQTLLKLTCPGVPDIYQGSDLWDLSLVDPDNRRPVDYIRRRQEFENIRKLGGEPDAQSASRLLERAENGGLKLFLMWKTLCFRKQSPEVFQQGEYSPLTVQGAKANHVAAFIRTFEKTKALVAVPRLVAGLLGERDIPPTGPEVWQDTEILLPSGVSSCGTSSEEYRDVFTGENINFSQPNAKIAVADLLARFPVALCWLDQSQHQGS
jgi:(1->4)-alpha-D-glucan 1-alpha-D-glucosylmutase